MKRFVLHIVLIFFVLLSTTTVYAQIQNNKSDVYINDIGDFYMVEQHLVSDSGARLVPVGVIQGVDDVYYIEYQYELIVKDGMDLNVLINDLMFSNELVNYDDLDDTFQFDISKKVLGSVDYAESLFANHEAASRIQITVLVSMMEPSTMELMQALAGGQLSFELYFYAMNHL